MKKNIASLFTNQGLNYLLPFIVMPYLVRVLGYEKYGLLALVQSVVQFLIVFVDYGYTYTATRDVSINRASTEAINGIFNRVVSVKVMLCIVGALVMAALTWMVPQLRENAGAFAIGYLAVIGSALFPNWLFQGIERMGVMALLNIGAKVLTTVATFFLVKTTADYPSAVLLQSANYFIPGVAGYLFAVKAFDLKFRRVSLSSIYADIISGWQMFSTTIVGNIYGQGALLAVGGFAGSEAAGKYALSQKISSAIVGVVQPFAQALYPRLCHDFNANPLRFKGLLAKTLSLGAVAAVVVLLALGTMAPLVISLVSGKVDQGASDLLRGFAFITAVVMMNVLMNAFITAKGQYAVMQKMYATASFVFIVVALPCAYAFGAKGMLGGVLAIELSVLAMSFYALKKNGQ